MTVGGGMVAAVGYAMIINMMASKETWPFFYLGFIVATISNLTLIALGGIGIILAVLYIRLKDMAKAGGGSNNGGGTGDPLGDILDNY
jgi:PTS system mannose-specific IIC component